MWWVVIGVWCVVVGWWIFGFRGRFWLVVVFSVVVMVLLSDDAGVGGGWRVVLGDECLCVVLSCGCLCLLVDG